MRAAGVRLDDGRAVWADAAGLALSPRDRVRVRLRGETAEGWVFVAPEQLLSVPPVSAVLESVIGAGSEDELGGDLPGADLPPLGSRFDTGIAAGVVTAIDPANRTITVTDDDGRVVELPMD